MIGNQYNMASWQSQLATVLASHPHVELRPSVHSSLTQPSERYPILLAQLSDDPALFLERYGRQVPREFLHQFASLPATYELKYWLRSLMEEEKQNSKTSKQRIRNRRYQHLLYLENETDYFSEENMAGREPELYDQYIGQYRPGGSLARFSRSKPPRPAHEGPERHTGRSAAQERPVGGGQSMTELVLKRYDQQHAQALRRELGDQPVHPVGGTRRNIDVPVSCPMSSMDEEEMDTPEAQGMDTTDTEPIAGLPTVPARRAQTDGSDDDSDDDGKWQPLTPKKAKPITDADRRQQEAEFLSIMKKRFLAGHSLDVDYDKIDNDDSLDINPEQDRDREEAYFDS